MTLSILLVGLLAPFSALGESHDDRYGVTATSEGIRVAGDVHASFPEESLSVDEVVEFESLGSVRVPARGKGVSLRQYYSDGSDAEARVFNRDGTITVDSEMAHMVWGGPSGWGPAACSDNAWTPFAPSFTWPSQFNWYMNYSSIPPGIDAPTTLQAIRDAGTAWAIVYNDCGIGDGSGLSVAYQGQTFLNVQMNAAGTACNGVGNGYNTVGFGTLPTSPNLVLGTACTWYSGPWATESDVRLLYSSSLWANANYSGCTSKFIVRAVMTHERGHTFGLNHVSENGHKHLTMSERIDPCDVNASTLGQGDAYGINALY